MRQRREGQLLSAGVSFGEVNVVAIKKKTPRAPAVRAATSVVAAPYEPPSTVLSKSIAWSIGKLAAHLDLLCLGTARSSGVRNSGS